jgi:NAD(P)-dependent dehydrogenase (short-subunit alcohol dehydrogenase family)
MWRVEFAAMESLKGKTVVVTGAAKRIGRAIAFRLAEAGADVAITYLRSEREAREAVSDISSAKVRGLALPCDVRDPESIETLVKEVRRELGGIDVLVNNAGLYETVTLETITLEQWEEMFATNTRGPFLVTRAASKSLRERKGRVINLGSLGGLRPWPTHAHYCASKAALKMLTQAMARALAPEVAVNCVAPGLIEFPETRRRGKASRDEALGLEFARKLAQRTPMKRNGTAEDVADAVLFFATASHFVTGQTLVVDGGLGLT